MTDIALTHSDLFSTNAGAIVLLALEDGDKLAGPAQKLDAQQNGLLSRLLDSKELSCKLGKVSLFFHLPGIEAACVAVVGGGSAAKFQQGQAFRAAGAAVKKLSEVPRKRIAIDFGDVSGNLLAAAVAGSINGGVGQDLFRAEKALTPPQEILWRTNDESQPSVTRGQMVGEAMLLARELVNLPANYLHPEEFARRAAAVAVSSGLELEVWDELRLRRERCDSLLGVSAGSSRPPRLLILRYRGTRQQPPLALVGKGVTFDSGGLSIKPSEAMLTMKCDMAGAASVLGTMQAIAQLKLPTPVVGLVGLVENMISGSAFKLGDVLTARSGKTIEIHNTDAEGRLVLADVLNVALDEKPSHIIDLATLTGACCVALGLDIAGLMSNDEALQSQLQAAAAEAGEDVWPLPMNEHFGDQIRGKIADIKNMGEGRWGGAITAAKFLEQFVDETPWVHVDIAGPAFLESPKAHMDAGGTGVMIRSLVQLIENMSKQ